jgi:hypothetical protein
MTQSRHFGQLSRFQMSRRKSVLPEEMMLDARAVSMKSCRHLFDSDSLGLLVTRTGTDERLPAG